MSLILASSVSGVNESANITTEALICTYTADAERWVVVQPRLSNLAATAAAITLRLEHTTGADAVLAYVADIRTAWKYTATNTVYGARQMGAVLLASGEKLKVYAKSDNAGDTAAKWDVKFINAGATATVLDKAGYSLTVTPPTAGDVAGAVLAGLPAYPEPPSAGAVAAELERANGFLDKLDAALRGRLDVEGEGEEARLVDRRGVRYGWGDAGRSVEEAEE